MEKDSFFEKLGKSFKLEDMEEGVPREEAGGAKETKEHSEAPEQKSQTPQTPEEYTEELPQTKEDKEEYEATENDVEGYEAPDATLAAANTKTAQKANKKKAEEKEKDDSEEDEGRLTIDVYETNGEIVIQSTLAGVKEDNLDINITTDSVAIKGRRERDEEVPTENYYYQETFWGNFSRSVILPTEIDPDKSQATLNNGILTIRMPKLTKTQQKKLNVKKVN